MEHGSWKSKIYGDFSDLDEVFAVFQEKLIFVFTSRIYQEHS